MESSAAGGEPGWGRCREQGGGGGGRTSRPILRRGSRHWIASAGSAGEVKDQHRLERGRGELSGEGHDDDEG